MQNNTELKMIQRANDLKGIEAISEFAKTENMKVWKQPEKSELEKTIEKVKTIQHSKSYRLL